MLMRRSVHQLCHSMHPTDVVCPVPTCMHRSLVRCTSRPMSCMYRFLYHMYCLMYCLYCSVVDLYNGREWNSIAAAFNKKMGWPPQQYRTAKQCQERYANHLRPDIRNVRTAGHYCCTVHSSAG